MSARNWTHWFWGRGLRGLRARYQRDGVRYRWWPVRLKVKGRDRRRGPFAWWRYSVLDWHGIEEGHESYPWPVRRATREVRPNPAWEGHHFVQWRRRLVAQVWHIGPFLIICGEHARPGGERLTDEDVRRIERGGRVVTNG